VDENISGSCGKQVVREEMLTRLWICLFEEEKGERREREGGADMWQNNGRKELLHFVLVRKKRISRIKYSPRPI